MKKISLLAGFIVVVLTEVLGQASTTGTTSAANHWVFQHNFNNEFTVTTNCNNNIGTIDGMSYNNKLFLSTLPIINA